jgi:hypothetical protein
MNMYKTQETPKYEKKDEFEEGHIRNEKRLRDQKCTVLPTSFYLFAAPKCIVKSPLPSSPKTK